MASITRLVGANGLVRSDLALATSPPVRHPKPPPAPKEHVSNNDTESRRASKRNGTGDTSSGRQAIRRYYIDELGFYRHLDPDQKQYVCSNLNAASMRASQLGGGGGSSMRLSSSGDGGYEFCFKAIRSELGISHFDRTDNYDKWKRDWDNFMRSKLIKQEPATLNNELKLRVRSGIPHDYRCKVWTALIRMRTRSLRAESGDDIYGTILREFVSQVDVPEYAPENAGENDTGRAHRRSSHYRPVSRADTFSGRQDDSSDFARAREALPSRIDPIGGGAQDQAQLEKCFRQIELDLLRTLPNNRHFEDPNSRGVQRVRRVLRAYACFNPTVGYCQGMNRLAAMALLVLPEEEAFWCLVAIIQCIMPKDYYLKPWLAQVDCCVLADLLAKKMPKLHKHLVNNDIQLTLFAWFFTIFVDGFRPELMLRIWDCFLLEGDKVLFRFALAILHISQADLLKIHDFSTMSAHLSRLVSTRRLDAEHLFETFVQMSPLSSGTLRSRRAFHRARIQSLLDE